MKSSLSLGSCEMPSICTRNSVLMRRLDSMSDSVREVNSESISSTKITADHSERSAHVSGCHTWALPACYSEQSLDKLLALANLNEWMRYAYR